MKVTVENKKGLNKDLKVFIDKETMNSYMDEKYEEIKGSVNLKGFRPGKVPKEILKRQFGKAVFGEVLDKVLKETSTKALEENKIKPAGQPKLDLKTYGEDKDLEYILSVTELPKVEIKSLENIKFDEYTVKIDESETDKRIKEIAKNQPNFKEVSSDTKAKKGDLVSLDYKATVDGKDFKGSEGKNTQLTLGKDLFLKGFDEQLIGVKKDDERIVFHVISFGGNVIMTSKNHQSGTDRCREALEKISEAFSITPRLLTCISSNLASLEAVDSVTSAIYTSVPLLTGLTDQISP